MENQEISLFGDDSGVTLPTSMTTLNNEVQDLISKDIGSAIEGETVKSLILDEDNEILLPNYIIDLSKLEAVEPIQIMALDSLLNEDGDMALYILIKGGIEKIGMAYKSQLDRILVPAMTSILGSEVLIYKDYKPGEKVVIADMKNLSKLRLTI